MGIYLCMYVEYVSIMIIISQMEEDRGGGFLPVGDPPPSKKSLPNPEPPEVEVATVKYRPVKKTIFVGNFL